MQCLLENIQFALDSPIFGGKDIDGSRGSKMNMVPCLMYVLRDEVLDFEENSVIPEFLKLHLESDQLFIEKDLVACNVSELNVSLVCGKRYFPSVFQYFHSIQNQVL